MNPITTGRSPPHVVAMPYPGRGHINPMLNLCNSLAARSADVVFSFVLTEEWLRLLGSVSKHPSIKFIAIPNVIVSELVRGAQFFSFMESVQSKMEEPFERLLDRLDLPVSVIIADTFLKWVVGVGNRRKIPVASLWTMSASVFSIFYHAELLVQNQHFNVELSEKGQECVDYIPGLSPMLVSDLPTIFFGESRKLLPVALESIQLVHNVQFLLFTSIYELEAKPVDALRAELSLPIYTFGPNIPYLKLEKNPCNSSTKNDLNYIQWLDSKPPRTVLYVSLGSFCPVSCAQMDEIAAGLRDSGVPYLWVAREESCRFNESCGNEGFVVPWCDQLRVLQHSSIGGFWTHGGWGSTMESVFAGIPMILFPLNMDQVPNRKLVCVDWKNGWKVNESAGREISAGKVEISELIRKFMDLENKERKEMMKRVKELQQISQRAIEKGGSSDTDFDRFIRDNF